MGSPSSWLRSFGGEGGPWGALGPAVLFAAYFIVGFVFYVLRYLVRGAYRDAEIEARGSSFLAGMFLRQYFVWLMQPIWRLVLRLGLPATAVTTLSVLLATASGVALSMGRFALGGWLYILAGICDFLDGRLARASNTASARGAALDAILDRYSDAAILVGLAWYYRESWVLLATQFALVGSSLVPYIRARGEAAGVSVKDVGFMQRAERILYLGVAVAMSPLFEAVPTEPHPLYRLAAVGVVLLAVSTQVTALQRFAHLMGALDERGWHRGWLLSGRSLTRHAGAAGIATLLDFLTATVLVSLLSAPLATFCGNVVGGVVSFGINRMWTLPSPAGRLPLVRRYAFLSLTSALLNAGGVAVLMLLPGIGFGVSWLLVHVAVFIAWNVPLREGYVFQADAGSLAQPKSNRQPS
jgi:phosphatidylglycerophosphate synthase/putative flippase GtrA